jgi:transcriptional regulator
MQAIVAFKIEILEMDHVFKLSQDRDEQSFHNIIRQLKQQGENARTIAKEMEKRLHELFP